MSSVETGSRAEKNAEDYVKALGYKILGRNWRTRVCEIDIVAKKLNTVYFIEVKYRKSPKWGSGLSYITPQKLRQMSFAAEVWVHQQRWDGEYCLSAIEVSGPQFRVTRFIEEL